MQDYIPAIDPDSKSTVDTSGPRPRGLDTRPPKQRRPRTAAEIQDEASTWRRMANFFTGRRTRAVLGIALVLFAAFLTVSAISFLRHGADDHSMVTSYTITEMTANPEAVGNVAGPVGATVSHGLFIDGLGLGSVVLIVYIALCGLGLLGVKRVDFWSLTFKSLILAITISMVLGLLSINSAAGVPLGGYHGRYINIWLVATIGWPGAMMVSILLVAVLATIYIAELAAIWRKSRDKIRNLQAKRLHESEVEAHKRDRVREALADGPLAAAATAEEPAPAEQEPDEVAAFHTPTETPSFTDIETAEPAERPAVPAPSPEDPEGPAFAVKQAEDIEEADPDDANEAYRLQGPYDPCADLPHFRMPTVDLLREYPAKAGGSVDLREQEENKERITKTLNDYGIRINRIEATVGPTVTLYEIVPAEGVRIAKIKSLENDIALSLAALGIRIIAPIPGKGTIGIEVPNKEPRTVSIREILGSADFAEAKRKYKLPIAMGATISNKVYIADLAKMPHLLVAGATGQGKSVGLNTIIASLLYTYHPAKLKFVMVDPKMVEFSLYASIEKHYLAKLPDEEEPVVTNPEKVVDTLNSLCVEMDSRYQLLKMAGCRSIEEYNKKFVERRLNPEKGHCFMPYIVMIVDEFADLIMMSGKQVEMPIARIAQKARAVGMHMIIATQRPSTNVITGIIKANFPARIAFRVSSMVDSRTILDSPGAQHLIGRGDMLISTGGPTERVQCAFIDTPEVEAICEYIDQQQGYDTAFMLPDPPMRGEGDSGGGFAGANTGDRDALFDEVARYVVSGNNGSTSMVQRKFSIGYNRAGKIMDQLEAAGIVGPASGGKPRNVLVDPASLESILG